MMFLLSMIFGIISVSQGDDPFESLLVRLECYPKTQDNCKDKRDFIEAYPDLAWSFTGTTPAETHFYMFSKENQDIPELIHKCGGHLPKNTKFNRNCRTEIFLPGFVSGICNFAIYRELKNERLKCGCYNVILVDWMWGNSFDLFVAKENIRIVAKQVAIVIRNIKKRFNIGPDKFILTGHSFGAHMAAFIANEEPVCIINGIEPSGVMADFSEDAPCDKRLDAGDAPCVQVLHGNGGQCLPSYFGVNYSCGTADFWINGGLHQPACYPQMFISFLKGDWIYALFSLLPAACFHFQVLQYYKASMNPTGCQFTGVQCDCSEDLKNGECDKDCGKCGQNCAIAGAYGCDCLKGDNKKGPKNYYFNTTLFCPFCDNSGINTRGVKCKKSDQCNKGVCGCS